MLRVISWISVTVGSGGCRLLGAAAAIGLRGLDTLVRADAGTIHNHGTRDIRLRSSRL
jgi:hypothetical protein